MGLLRRFASWLTPKPFGRNDTKLGHGWGVLLQKYKKKATENRGFTELLLL
jgi:hypothetical protein